MIPVICDLCSKDWTFNTTSGGLIVCGWGVCPDCEESMMKSIKENNEEHTIEIVCPSNISYAQFIFNYRKGQYNLLINS